MPKRFVTIWFCNLRTDWFTIRKPVLQTVPFVLTAPDHGRLIITAVNKEAVSKGIETGMVLADAKAIFPSLVVCDDNPALAGKLLKSFAEYCIRYTPAVAIDPPDGLILDASGCAHLWNGEKNYLHTIASRINAFGYTIRLGMADSIGAAWAVSRYSNNHCIIEPGQQSRALLMLPAAALRLETTTVELLNKLGLRQIRDFIGMPRSALRRRFGQAFIQKLDRALGHEEEFIDPVVPLVPYQFRLPCLDSIVTATGIEIALQRLLEMLCERLQEEQKGIRLACLRCYRVDGRMEKIEISTSRPSHNISHLFKLFELKISGIEPGPGIEIFVLESSKVEEVKPLQEKLWERPSGLEDTGLSELLDRIAGKIGNDHIYRYLPDEHYWPERSFKLAKSLQEKINTEWRFDRPRPMQLLSRPEPIEVTAPIPDYPPMIFRYKGKLHKIIKADGPERIEQEWWLQQGLHRDYYSVEDEEGCRYWLFRLGHYSTDRSYQWFIHGFFA